MITILKPFDTFVLITTTSSSITLSPIGIGLIVTPIPTGMACGLTISSKVNYEIVMQKKINTKTISKRSTNTKIF